MPMTPKRSRAEQRRCVLSLYRQILKTGKNWEGPKKEKVYIDDEAKRLFKRNKNIEDKQIIDEKIFEAESRLTLGVHYKFPYPRLYTTVKNEEANEDIRPAYMHSYFEDKNEVANYSVDHLASPSSSYLRRRKNYFAKDDTVKLSRGRTLYPGEIDPSWNHDTEDF
eukprot:gb/GECH01013497.1/.p1 GENE.gb/GECH01013497.1/~~gb/GECH01013497.1/.p1  ORF type:complete len:166 (+),score=36.17 gb/GECH01013497.1/:1-498(+)